jgi:hypothetical protein
MKLRGARAVTAFAIAVLAMFLSSGLPAVAQTQKKLVNGCTAAQIQSPKAKQCIDQQERDVIAGRSVYHALYCSSSGAILCCQYENGRILDASCSVQSGVPRPGGGAVGPLNGVVEPGPSTSPATTGGFSSPLSR